MKRIKYSLICFISSVIAFFNYTSLTAHAEGDVASAVEGTWNSAKNQIKTVTNNVIFPVIDVVLVILLFVKLCPVNWFSIEADTDFSTIVGCALRYALGRYTYIPSTVKGFIERHIEAITEKDLNVMISDIEAKMQYNKELPYKELWLELRDSLVIELKKREESQSKGRGNNGNNNN